LLLILTPQEQQRQTEDAFVVNGEKPVRVEDVFCVPDYKEYFKGYTKIKRAFKPYKEKPRSQLQFIVEAVEPNKDTGKYPAEFPLGVRTFYRAYPTDETIEIVQKTSVR
jgi:hypothetical protein